MSSSCFLLLLFLRCSSLYPLLRLSDSEAHARNQHFYKVAAARTANHVPQPAAEEPAEKDVKELSWQKEKTLLTAISDVFLLLFFFVRILMT